MPLPAFRFPRWLGALLLIAAGLLVLAASWWSWPRAVPAPLVPPASATARPAGPPPPDGRMRGVSWVGTDSVSTLDLEPLTKAGVTWIAQMPFGWMAGATEPSVQLRTGVPSRRYWGESDAGILFTARRARQRGIRTLLKPHLWLRGPGGSWVGDINMTSEADWQAWFSSYSAFILHYARLAEAGQLDALCIGTELERTVGHEAEWRALIRQIRQVYRGPLTYAANWSGEFEQVKFWDALDFIGVQAYFPLSTEPSPKKAQLLAGWREPLRRIAAVQKQYNKPVVFTEAGYKTTVDAAAKPWEWPQKLDVLTPTDEATQAACYAALFETFWPKPWFKGIFIWKWYPGLQPDGPSRRHADFTPQHKPAERVMSEWFLKGT
ncbi:glycoside hydrolase family 113 [Hymenobacter lapidiphilus]|uniref:GTA TIM-barrel-like domain-containing protein n=1 Tax=Hymenobacter lapidiphilus TaxID=2608003 RepID=A0A7Y7U6N5_9BACT|nr:hypothetical protein [Hymenobacter lapidiphilus]NVO33001.1 hypothetical protein [Hymenobacter lapidiphilus]